VVSSRFGPLDLLRCFQIFGMLDKVIGINEIQNLACFHQELKKARADNGRFSKKPFYKKTTVISSGFFKFLMKTCQTLYFNNSNHFTQHTKNLETS
jgi:hypothetical protein